jgi:hypothetical protein
MIGFCGARASSRSGRARRIVAALESIKQSVGGPATLERRFGMAAPARDV